jgi:2-oxoglutarate dehydrogenase E1 component
MTPKSLLRHAKAISTIEELAEGKFQEIIDDNNIKAKDVKTVVCCSGKLYYELLSARDEAEVTDIAIIRLEQLYPFPQGQLNKLLKKYKASENLLWVQEEPENMGAWHFIDRRLESILIDLEFKQSRPQYVGRPEAASPATGFSKVHSVEQEKLVKKALTFKKGK